MSKFKVGDIVVGNALADKRYAITVTGTVMRVLNTADFNDGVFEGEILSAPSISYESHVGAALLVHSKYFDLEALHENE